MVEKRNYYTTYIAMDGKEFSDQTACRDYERKLQEKKRAEREDMLRAAAKIDKELWGKYFPEQEGEINEPTPEQAVLWLEYDLPAIALKSRQPVTLADLRKEIEDYPNGKDVLKHLDFTRLERNVTIRRDWESALKTEDVSDLSSDIGYILSDYDLTKLEKIHKKKKYRKKIERLLTNLNFHYEAGSFAEGTYERA